MKTNQVVTDGDLALLRGVRYLDMTGCQNITDDSLPLVAVGCNLHTLNITGCWKLTNAAFAHLAGIHTLNMSSCDQNTITDAAFSHLTGIHTLAMANCNQNTITDAAFAHLTGIHTLWINRCNQNTITDAAFAHLAGIRELNMSSCNQVTITDAAFTYLAGILTIHLFGCNLTPKAMHALIVAVINGTFGRFVRKVYMDEDYTYEFDDELLWFRDYGVIVATQY